MIKDYSKFSKEELIEFIKELQTQLKNEKYGLYWDRNIQTEKEITLILNNVPLFKRNNYLSNYSINNILVESDNFHFLVVLNTISSNLQVDMIYIDPPYNTGNKDFVYNDSIVNVDDGFRHSKWLTFMENRLLLAKNLLKESGTIFISIDDNEFSNLKLLCDKIFGSNNFVGNLIWKSKSGGANDSSFIATDHEYILVYCKNFKYAKFYKDKNASVTTSYNQEDEKGRYSLDRLDKQSLGYHASLDYPIIGPDGKTYTIYHKNPAKKQARWRWGIETVKERYDELVFKWPYVYTKNYEKKNGQTPRTILFEDRFGRTRTGSTDLKEVIGTQSIFTYPKPVSLLKYLINIGCSNDGLVLDFFAGSGTTGQAVLELNKEDGGNRRFILCTNNENNICTDVTYPRLKTVITGIRPDGTKYSDGIPANLIYYKTDFIKDSNNIDQAKYCLVEKVDELLCISEDIFTQLERNEYSSHYVSNDKSRHMFIYSDYYNETKFNEFKQRVLNANDKKIVYIFSSDNNVDETLFEGIKDVELKPIPSKIYEIYKEIVEDIKRGQ